MSTRALFPSPAFSSPLASENACDVLAMAGPHFLLTSATNCLAHALALTLPDSPSATGSQRASTRIHTMACRVERLHCSHLGVSSSLARPPRGMRTKTDPGGAFPMASTMHAM